MSPQIPLVLGFPPDQQFESFEGQAELRDLVRDVALGLRPEWLFLSGVPATGKTHLQLAACTVARQHDKAAAFFPLSALSGRLDEALAGQDPSALTCLDGVESIAGSLKDELALFQFHNAARQNGGRLIYAGRAMPAALPFVLPDLVSRLSQCTRLSVLPLGESGRREVLRQRARRRGFELDDVVLDYLFRHIGRDLASLGSLFDRLDRASLAAQRRITVPFLRSVLDDRA